MTAKTFNARCGGCDHVWEVCRLPKPVLEVANLAIAASKAPCPNCKQKTKIFVAPSAITPAPEVNNV